MSTQAKTAVNTTEAPAAIGPYSQAIRAGDLLFTSGQIGLDPKSGQMVAGGVAEQAERVLRNLQAVLSAAGLDLSHVVKTTIYLKSMGDFGTVNEVYGRFFASGNAVPPARSTVAAAGLPKDALVEIEAIARG